MALSCHLWLLSSWNPKAIMAYFPDYGERENVDPLTECFLYFSQPRCLGLVFSQDISYYCKGLFPGIGCIYVPLFQTVLKMCFYSHHYLFSSKHRVVYLDQVHLTTPGWFFHPYMLQIPYVRSFIFLSPACWLTFLRARVTHAMLSQQGSQERGKQSNLESIPVKDDGSERNDVR